ncbi:MAG TPA: LysM peptidoglycan-binding domain-containing protein, partial [Rhizobiaceae bacterium]|nr:LysM peptidoglycan-binding domain-containing protein [Rhizobiaceae bacterium]
AGGAESADGSFQMSRRVGGFGLRGQIVYALTPGTSLTTIALSADKNIALGYLLNMGVTRDVAARHTQYTVGLNKSIGAYALRVSGGYSTRGDITLGTQLFMSMGREPLSSAWVFDALPMADSGAVSARVFVDKNQNGIMDTDEESVEGVGFLVNGGRRPVRTDAAGVAYLGRLPVRQNVDIGVDPANLEDPQWSAQPGGARLVPRPGKATVLAFPVIMTSEIDGTIYLIENDENRSIGDVMLELIDAQGKLVGEAKSASDGFYIVPSVPAGNYRLRVSPKQLERLNLTDTGTRIITVSPDGTFLNGVDFYLIPLSDSVSEPVPPASTAPEPVATVPAQAAPHPAHGAENRYYTVREGDWLWKIAKMFYGEAATAANASEMMQANRDIIEDSHGLRPGQRLLIPADAPFFPAGRNP